METRVLTWVASVWMDSQTQRTHYYFIFFWPTCSVLAGVGTEDTELTLMWDWPWKQLTHCFLSPLLLNTILGSQQLVGDKTLTSGVNSTANFQGIVFHQCSFTQWRWIQIPRGISIVLEPSCAHLSLIWIKKIKYRPCVKCMRAKWNVHLFRAKWKALTGLLCNNYPWQKARAFVFGTITMVIFKLLKHSI